MGRYDEAEDHLRRAVQLADVIHPRDAILLAGAVNGLGILLKDTGRFNAAGALYQRAMSLVTEIHGPDSAELASLFHNLAGLEHARGRFADGEPYARRAIALRDRVDGPTSTGMAGDRAVLGALLLEQGRLTEAEHELNQALHIWQQRFGADHYEVAIVQHNLAAVHARRGDYAQAENAYCHALEIKRRILGAQHPESRLLEEQRARVRPNADCDRQRSNSLLLNPEYLHSGTDGAGSGGDVEFDVDGTQMGVNGAAADVELCGDLSIGESSADKRKSLDLASAEPARPRCDKRVELGDELSKQSDALFWVQCSTGCVVGRPGSLVQPGLQEMGGGVQPVAVAGPRNWLVRVLPS